MQLTQIVEKDRNEKIRIEGKSGEVETAYNSIRFSVGDFKVCSHWSMFPEGDSRSSNSTNKCQNFSLSRSMGFPSISDGLHLSWCGLLELLQVFGCNCPPNSSSNFLFGISFKQSTLLGF